MLDLRETTAPYEPAAKLTTKANIRFAFSVFGRALRSDYTLAVDDAGWTSIVQTFAIRDRITLPRSARELDITDDEIRTVHAADVWFDERCAEAMRRARYEAAPERTA